MTTTVNLIPVIVEREHATLPEWCDSWGIKSVQPDLRTHGGYQWPFPGQTAACDPDRLVPENARACPSQDGDGLCVATSWQGMASGGIPARTMLLVAYASTEVLGYDTGKLRLPRVAVVALVDGQRLLREAGSGANLRGADLRGANLYGANLSGTNLRGANLYGADLRSANLRGADLRGANLYGTDLRSANLSGTNLRGANLYGANLSGTNLYGANLYGANLSGTNLYGADLYGTDLRGANLYGADLRGTNLSGTDLSGTDLRGANLRGANLRGADLRGADLRGANLRDTRHDATTVWPDDYKPVTV